MKGLERASLTNQMRNSLHSLPIDLLSINELLELQSPAESTPAAPSRDMDFETLLERTGFIADYQRARAVMHYKRLQLESEREWRHGL